MSEYVLSNGITTLAINLEDGSWRVLGTDSRFGAKALYYEWDTGQLLGSTKGRAVTIEPPGAESDDEDPIQYEVETPGQALSAGQTGIVQRVFIDVNTRGEELRGAFVLDGAGVIPFPYAVTTPVRQVWECNAQPGVGGRIFGVRLSGDIARRIDLYGIDLLISYGEQEDQLDSRKSFAAALSSASKAS